VAYSTGWGSILPVGFLFSAAGAFRLFGSKARTPNLVCTAIAVTLGQVAIALHIAPSILDDPQMQGAAPLGLFGALLVIHLLGQ
jgi:hypothetical protein